ncbi:MAG: energy-coupling factor transporter transmembrane component T family protein [Oscillospiraceae bacterium]
MRLPQSLRRGGEVLTTALGAVSAMYLLALTTPIHEITSTLSRLHVPGILIELMYLIYRFIFLLSETAHQMHMAAQSRLGYWGWRQSMQTFGKSMANLLVTALRQAGNTYDAMVARCYDGRLAFWTEAKPVTPVQVAAVGGYLACLAAVWLLERKFL